MVFKCLYLFLGGFLDAVKGIGSTIMDGDPKNILERNVGLFLHCKVIRSDLRTFPYSNTVGARILNVFGILMVEHVRYSNGRACSVHGPDHSKIELWHP